jgi:hypothetical protein
MHFTCIKALEISVIPISSTKNCGVVTIEEGEVFKEELAKEFSNFYETNWPWHIRELRDWSYLVKFPPHTFVDQVRVSNKGIDNRARYLRTPEAR